MKDQHFLDKNINKEDELLLASAVESMMERALDNGRILMPTASVLID
jgi:hypothetical protein